MVVVDVRSSSEGSMLKLKIEELTQVPWRLAMDRALSNVEDVGCTEVSQRLDHTVT